MNAFKDIFLLDPQLIFLNHGSYGATPRPVLEACQEWQRRLERDPVHFINDELMPLLGEARAALGRYLNAGADDLVYIPNATFGLNVIARSLPLKPGDEVLATDHEYGSVNNIWVDVCDRRGVSYTRQAIDFPAASAEAMLEQLWGAVTPRTRAIFISHITSSTALRLPVEALCVRARAAGILTVIDGAHAPSQIPLDLAALDPDFYVGNCHKWLCSPKGAAFLYTRPALQPLIVPVVIGWGWGENRRRYTGSDYLDSLQWLGTNDLSAYLSVPAAIDFQASHDWPAVRARCRDLLAQALPRAMEITNMPSPYPTQGRQFEQMAVFELPPGCGAAALAERLYRRHRIQIPGMEWNGRQFLRISMQAYNTEQDLDALFNALGRELTGT